MKYKFISFINLFGLTIGLTCCFLILAYILHEVSYDKFQPNADRVYRVTRTFYNGQTGAKSLYLSTIAPAFGPYLENDFKEIESMTRVYPNGSTAVKYGDKKFNEQNTFFADDKFFKFFKVDVLQGNPAKALTDPYSVMMSEEMAKKYFGSDDPMNKVLSINMGNYFDFKVTGIYKSFPSNTHFHPELMFSFNTLNDTLIYGAENLRTSFGNNSFFTYIRLPKGYDPQRLESQFPAFVDRTMATEYAGAPFKPSKGTALGLQKLTDIHLRSHTDYEAEENGDIKRVWIFSAIALFILLIACINYMNLSTARSTLRAREIGIRKVAGAQRSEIITQFLSESVLVSWIAMLLAFGLTMGVLPWLNKISGQQLDINILLKWQIIIPVLITPFLVGIISGIYPALFMSSFQPVKVLKGNLQKGKKSGGLRSVLVIFQFATSIFLIIGTIIIFRQLHFIQTKNLGFNKDQVLIINDAYVLKKNSDAFKNEVIQMPGVISGTLSSFLPVSQSSRNDNTYSKDAVMDAKNGIDMQTWSVDYDYLKTLGIDIKKGRNFSKDFGTDSTAMIINETTEKFLGYDDPIGKKIYTGADIPGKMISYNIIGVAKNFNFESLHQSVGPLAFLLHRSTGLASFKIKPDNVSALIKGIENKWKSFAAGMPFSYRFLDDSFSRMYSAEQRVGKIALIFSILAILIACLGLFGLATFIAEQRTKEIGIRKVLGATVNGIVQLLSKDFIKLVFIAFVIAAPLALWAMNTWLQDFVYRVNISWWIFLLAIGIALFIALATISFQAIKAAIANPVKNLRTE